MNGRYRTRSSSEVDGESTRKVNSLKRKSSESLQDTVKQNGMYVIAGRNSTGGQSKRRASLEMLTAEMVGAALRERMGVAAVHSVKKRRK